MDVITTLQKYTTTAVTDEKLVIKKELSAYLNYLLLNDFAALLQILYKVDVSEEKLKLTLKENEEADAGDLLAELIIDRELQKRTARSTTSLSDDLSKEEKW